MSAGVGGSRYYRVLTDSDALFWFLHCAGWMGISLITYVSLSLPYDQFDFVYLAHNGLQSLLGLLLSLPMRYVFQRIWHLPLGVRLFIIIVVSLGFSAAWSVLRLLLFMAITGERGLWPDFGGWLFPSIFVFLTWSALYHSIKYYRLLQREHEQLIQVESRQRAEALRLATAEAEVRAAQLALLRYQLNPHFLFNTLNSISALVNVDRRQGALDMLQRLSGFLRASLEAGQKTMNTVADEFSALSLYLEIEKVRFVDRMNLDIEMDPNISDVEVPSLLLQPLVENSIKYAISKNEQGGTIKVTCQREGDRLSLVVEDSGSGEPFSVPDSIENVVPMDLGVGLRNTRDRLQTVYGDRYALSFSASTLGGLCVSLSLPLSEVENDEPNAD